MEFEGIFVKALGGLLDVGSRAAMATVGHEAIVEAYRKRGHEVADIDDIGKLELCEMDKVRPNLGLAYTAVATVEGAAAGFAVSGGEIVAAGGSVFGAGVGGAPGIGTVVGVMAADAAVVLVAANRAVAHIAAYYGYDVDHPDERLFALGVLSVGTAAEASKATAYIELNKLVQALARRATWDQLRQNAVTRVVEKVFTRLGYRITQRKLGQAVPVFGTVIGAGMNAHLLSSVTHDANHIYRERFLRDHYGLAHEPLATPSMNETDVVDVAELLHEEIAKEDGRPTDGGDGERS
ncbi:EcsC family protein [Kribbella qitaiheensis]|uniref:EcsC family protein n=1 Tax=Kribbella qitaiheensis TaxID=1544730 RepID=UPI0036205E65